MTLEVLENADHTIHEIIDQSEVANIPNNINEINSFTSPVTNHDKMGWIIIYGRQNKLLKFIASIAGHVTCSNNRLVDTRQDAIKSLIKLEPSLAEHLNSLVE